MTKGNTSSNTLWDKFPLIIFHVKIYLQHFFSPHSRQSLFLIQQIFSLKVVFDDPCEEKNDMSPCTTHNIQYQIIPYCTSMLLILPLFYRVSDFGWSWRVYLIIPHQHMINYIIIGHYMVLNSWDSLSANLFPTKLLFKYNYSIMNL